MLEFEFESFSKDKIRIMKRAFIHTVLLILIGIYAVAQSTHSTVENLTKPLKFIKKQIASESFEFVDVFDVNNDKILDIVSGAFWYEGPGFWEAK